jgi:hypothetical protein
MRWSPRGDYLTLEVRTSVVDRTFDRDSVVAALSPPVGSLSGMTTPAFWTVSAVDACYSVKLWIRVPAFERAR